MKCVTEARPTTTSCDQSPVDIARETEGPPSHRLIAILIANGVTDTAELSALTGLTIRSVQHVRRAIHCAPKAQPIARNATHCAQSIAPKKEIPPTPPKEKTTSLVESHHSLSQPARVREVALAGGESEFEARVGEFLGTDAVRARSLIADLTASHGETPLREGFAELAAKARGGEPIRNPWKALPAFVASAASRRRCGTISGDEIARQHREINRRISAQLKAEGYF